MVSLADLLGMVVILGSVGVKIPMIINLYRMKSGEGLSLSSLYMQNLSMTAFTLYHVLKRNPLSAWLEWPIVLVQNFTLTAQVWFYARSGFQEVAFAVGTWVALSGAMLFLDENLQWILPTSSTVIGMAGQLPQIYTNFQLGQTGPQSAITHSLNVLGIGARIYTTLQLPNYEMSELASIVISLSLQAILLLQILWMRNATRKAAAEQASKKKE